MNVARGKPAPSSAPLLWRMRHSLGRVWFGIAMVMIGLGAFAAIYGIVTGALDLLGVGLTLAVGGALLAVGFRARK